MGGFARTESLTSAIYDNKRSMAIQRQGNGTKAKDTIMTKWLIGIIVVLGGFYMLLVPPVVKLVDSSTGILLRQLFISEDAKHCFNGMVRGERLVMKQTECPFENRGG